MGCRTASHGAQLKDAALARFVEEKCHWAGLVLHNEAECRDYADFALAKGLIRGLYRCPISAGCGKSDMTWRRW